uniref:Uncharacterized protein n=1 Tax=Arundo donax TaxID=35708 RepID=A0A0A9AB99_ARUDO
MAHGQNGLSPRAVRRPACASYSSSLAGSSVDGKAKTRVDCNVHHPEASQRGRLPAAHGAGQVLLPRDCVRCL